MPSSRDLREFFECLNSSEVEYLIVVALVGSWHGFTRYSSDVDFGLDFLVRPSEANAARELQALFRFGFGNLDISLPDLTSPGKVIQLGYEPNRIDMMTSVTGVSFHDAWDDRALIGRSCLLRNKDATGRAKDQIDAEELRKQRPST